MFASLPGHHSQETFGHQASHTEEVNAFSITFTECGYTFQWEGSSGSSLVSITTVSKRIVNIIDTDHRFETFSDKERFYSPHI